jgi:serine/threonine protein kinase
MGSRDLRMVAMAQVLAGLYELTALIGRGPTGTVWRGRDRSTRENIAVKVLHPELSADPGTVDRFIRERPILTAFLHPAFVRVRDLVTADGIVALVMELITGWDLRRHIDHAGPLPLSMAAEIAATLAEALASAHDAGVVHCDVKPSNVLLAEPTGDARLTDCRVARLGRGSQGRAAWYTNPAYAAPEVIRGGPPQSATDVYALGLVLWEMVTGATHFEGADVEEVLASHLGAEPTLPDAVPSRLRRIMEDCLRREPAERPTVEELALRLHLVREWLSAVAERAPRTLVPPNGGMATTTQPLIDTGLGSAAGPRAGLPDEPSSASSAGSAFVPPLTPPMSPPTATAVRPPASPGAEATLPPVPEPTVGDVSGSAAVPGVPDYAADLDGQVWPQPVPVRAGRDRSGRPRLAAIAGGLLLMVATLFGVVLLSSKTDDGQTGAGSGAQTSPRSANPSATEPQLATAPPGSASPATAEGATTFVHFWFETLDVAVRTGDTSILEAASSPSCDACRDVIQVIRDGYREGGVLRGGSYSVRVVNADDFFSADRPAVRAVFDRSPRSAVDADGQQHDVFPGGTFLTCQVLLERANGHWRVLEIFSPGGIA